jgi:hypothetical protein
MAAGWETLRACGRTRRLTVADASGASSIHRCDDLAPERKERTAFPRLARAIPGRRPLSRLAMALCHAVLATHAGVAERQTRRV